MGRKASLSPLCEVHIHLHLREGEDDDLIQYFKNIPPGKLAVSLKIALRSGGIINDLQGGEPEPELLDNLGDFLK